MMHDEGIKGQPPLKDLDYLVEAHQPVNSRRSFLQKFGAALGVLATGGATAGALSSTGLAAPPQGDDPQTQITYIRTHPGTVRTFKSLSKTYRKTTPVSKTGLRTYTAIRKGGAGAVRAGRSSPRRGAIR